MTDEWKYYNGDCVYMMSSADHMTIIRPSSVVMRNEAVQ